MRFAPGGLQLSVGTASGHVAIYDIRRGAPLLVKDHQVTLALALALTTGTGYPSRTSRALTLTLTRTLTLQV